MDTTEHQDHQDGTTCMMCSLHKAVHGKSICGMCGGANHFSLLRVVIALVVAVIIFWLGVHVGERHSHRNFGYGNNSRQGMTMIRTNGYGNYGGYGQAQMTQGNVYYQGAGTAGAVHVLRAVGTTTSIISPAVPMTPVQSTQ